MKYLFLSAMIFSSMAFAGEPCFGPGDCTIETPVVTPCFGPGGCGVVDPNPTGPVFLCIPAGCNVVTYRNVDGFVIAVSQLPNGYPVIGWSGACLDTDCPDIYNQAFADLELNAKRANRAQRY